MKWIEIDKDGPPTENVIVLVSGGTAKYRNGQWYSGMEEPLFCRQIEWEVKCWMPIPVKE